MRNIHINALVVSLAVAASFHVLVSGQGITQNVNVITGSSDQFIGDEFRQRQVEPSLAISSINPAHMMAAYVDYRTVDFDDDPVAVNPPSLFARLLNFFRAPWTGEGEREREREREREGERAGEYENEAAEKAAAQAWIGLSFSDNGGKDWYTGLHPGRLGLPPPDTDPDFPDQSFMLNQYDAMSDPVLASTHNRFYLVGIAFNPDNPQQSNIGTVSRFTDKNDTETGRNIDFDGMRVALAVGGVNFFVDKPNIAAAPGPNGNDYVYAAFVVFDENDPEKLSSRIQFVRSTDSGKTWSAPITVSQPLSRNQAPWILVDPNNPLVVYLGWRVFSSQTGGWTNAIVGKRSNDGGASFTPSLPYPVAPLLKAFDQPQVALSATTFPVPRSNAYPTAVIDGNGAIHMALQEYVNPSTGLPLSPVQSPTTGVPRITVTSSYNQGSLWTLRRAVDFGPGSGTQFMPVLTSAGEQGDQCSGSKGPRSRVTLMYYDARAGGAGLKAGTLGHVVSGNTQFDVRLAEASACDRDFLGRLIFGSSQQVSQYSRSVTPPHDIVKTAGFDQPAVNKGYLSFCGGTCSFSGDYIHLIPRVPYVLTSTGWKRTTATAVDRNTLPAPVLQGMWADARDVKLPTVGPLPQPPPGASGVDVLPWPTYSPPGTGMPSCVNPGARDLNIYSAEYAPGAIFAAAPETFRVSNIPHAYPIYLESRSAQLRLYKLTIDSQASASFDYRSFDPPPEPLDKDADIALGAFSTATGSVVIGPGQANPVTITVAEIDGNGNILSNGSRTSVTIFTSGAQGATNTETHAPTVDQQPIVARPFPPTTFPVNVNPTTPFTQNPFTQNPFSQNQFQTPFTQNPFTQNPFTQNTNAQDQALGTIYDIVDINFLVKMANDGNAAAAYAALLNVQNALQLQGSYLFQVLINRISTVPGLEGCLSGDQSQPFQISSFVTPFTQNPFTQNPFTQNPFTQNPFTQNPFTQNPFTQNPFTQNPFTQNPNPSDPVVSNSTFYLAPPATPEQTSRATVPPGVSDPAAGAQLALRDGTENVRLQRVAGGQLAPMPPNFRAERPPDEVIYTLRAYQIRQSNDPEFVSLFQNGDETKPNVGVTVIADVPDVIEVGGVTQFDPGGPRASSGGAAVPVKLSFITQPTQTNAGATISPAVRVAIQDGFGNLLDNAALPVTLTIGNNPGEATLTGTTTVNAVEGIATFANLIIKTPGENYTLVASSPGLANATSDPFDVVTGFSGSLSDAAGDVEFEADPDLVSGTVVVQGGNVTLTANFNASVASNAAVQFVLDIDENASTGHQGSDSGCSNDNGIIGIEYIVDMGPGSIATVVDGGDESQASIRQFVGSGCNIFGPPVLTSSGSVETGENSLSVTFPLSLIGGDDGKMRFKVLTYRHLEGNAFTGILDRMTEIGQPAGVVD